MPTRTFGGRLTLAVSVVLAATAVAALPARADDPPPAPYSITLSADPASTDFAHRTVDLSGVLTKADGTPVADGQVKLTERLHFCYPIYDTDPRPPDACYYDKSHDLGTLHTGQDGRFTLPGTRVDNIDDVSLIDFTGDVFLDAVYDPDGDPATDNSVQAEVEQYLPTVQTSLTAKVDHRRLYPGDVATVTGTVTVPPGYGRPEGTEVSLFASEGDYGGIAAVTTADAAGHFTLRYKDKGFAEGVAVISQPKDPYLRRADVGLNLAYPQPLAFSGVSAAVDRNGVATVKGRIGLPLYSHAKEKVNLQFAATGEKTWHTVATVVNDSDGYLNAAYKGGNGIYRWSHPESDAYALISSVSRTVYRVPERIAGFRGTPQPVRKGTPLRLSGTLQFLDGNTWKNRGVHPVEIWYRPTSTSTWVRKAVINSSGTGYFQKTLTATTDGWWRAVQTGDATDTYTAVSPSDWIDVR